jgi:hypothetical protein
MIEIKENDSQILVEYEGDEGMIFIWVDKDKINNYEIQDKKLLGKLTILQKVATFLVIASFNLSNKTSASQKFKESINKNAPVELRIVEYKPFTGALITVPEKPSESALKQKNILLLENGKKNLVVTTKPQRGPVGSGIILQKSNLAKNNVVELQKSLLPQRIRKPNVNQTRNLKLRGGMTKFNSLLNWSIEKGELIILKPEKLDLKTKVILLTNPAVWVGILVVIYRDMLTKVQQLIHQKKVTPTIMQFIKKNPLKLIISGIVMINTKPLFGLITSQASRQQLISEINTLVDNIYLKIWGTPAVCDTTDFSKKIKMLEEELALFKYKAENRLKLLSLKNVELNLQQKEISETRLNAQEMMRKCKEMLDNITLSKVPERIGKPEYFAGPEPVVIDKKEPSVINKKEPLEAGKIVKDTTAGPTEKKVREPKPELNNREPGRSSILREAAEKQKQKEKT